MKENHASTRTRPYKTMLAFCIVGFVIILSCANSGTAPTAQDQDGIVVEAYLYAGQPVNDVRIVHLTKIIYDTLERLPVTGSPGDSTDTTVTKFRDSTYNNAVVTITTNGKTFPLASQDSGWYADATGSLAVNIGQTYRIDVSAGGEHAWAQTTVPTPVGGLSVSRDTLYVAARSTGGGGGFTGGGGAGGGTGTTATALPESLTTTTLRWNNASAAYLYYKYSLDTVLANSRANLARNGSYTSADSVTVSSSRSGTAGRGFQTAASATVIGLTTVGKYRVLLYTTTPDYRAMLSSMADTSSQDEYSESPTNVTNGFGFFTSFSLDSTFLYVATASSN
jgi:hypothetical protein